MMINVIGKPTLKEVKGAVTKRWWQNLGVSGKKCSKLFYII